MVVSVTQGFMIYAFIRKSLKAFKNDRLTWLFFFFENEFVFVYMCP